MDNLLLYLLGKENYEKMTKEELIKMMLAKDDELVRLEYEICKANEAAEYN